MLREHSEASAVALHAHEWDICDAQTGELGLRTRSVTVSLWDFASQKKDCFEPPHVWRQYGRRHGACRLCEPPLLRASCPAPLAADRCSLAAGGPLELALVTAGAPRSRSDGVADERPRRQGRGEGAVPHRHRGLCGEVVRCVGQVRRYVRSTEPM